jgi:hypothetical protein
VFWVVGGWTQIPFLSIFRVALFSCMFGFVASTYGFKSFGRLSGSLQRPGPHCCMHAIRSDFGIESFFAWQELSWSLALSPRCSRCQHCLGRSALEATSRLSTSWRCYLGFAHCTCLPFVTTRSKRGIRQQRQLVRPLILQLAERPQRQWRPNERGSVMSNPF